jgi:hypothetical protein
MATDLTALRRLIEEHRIGRTYGEHLLWLAFVLIAIEFCYANALLRRGSRLSDKLAVDSAGRVQKHAPLPEPALSTR